MPLKKDCLKDLAEFYSQEEKALHERYNLVEKIIGRNHHNLSVGIFCENLVKEYIRKNLPQGLSVDSGFIHYIPNNAPVFPVATPQIDIIIYDDSCYPPLVRTNEFVVVEPKAVHAAIEVKKNLTSKNLYSAIKNTSESLQFALHSNQISLDGFFTGIFAFSSSIGKEAICQVLKNAKDDDLMLPNAICILKKILLTYEKTNGYEMFQITKGEKKIQGSKIFFTLQGFLCLLFNNALGSCGKDTSRFSIDRNLESEYILFLKKKAEENYSYVSYSENQIQSFLKKNQGI